MLSGRVGNKLVIESIDVKDTQIKELKTFILYVNGRKVGRTFYFTGREYYLPWIEIDYDPWLREIDGEVDLFNFIYNTLLPGGKLFVTYIRDKETAGMLYQGFSPADTPLGFSLLKAGFTWFKHWYFPEGGNEGAPKIQANKPLNDTDMIRQLRELLDEVKRNEVKAFIESKIAKRKS
ncbi:hypothetical protein SUSAZ_00330 [Sulfolobus acidocaldarius SUSAZ]|nr:hypothetical protein SUSAZ_00330 [Sulfolobus acidocaldarius SUSAZ]